MRCAWRLPGALSFFQLACRDGQSLALHFGDMALRGLVFALPLTLRVALPVPRSLLLMAYTAKPGPVIAKLGKGQMG